MKKPPELYRSKKGILKNLIKNAEALGIIKEAVIRVNKITISVYQFIKAYYLFCTEFNHPVPVINVDFIDAVIKLLSN